jgi:NAD(P)-dependent dehydrogenase (short-subunit alcohol dehydrogenase family)
MTENRIVLSPFRHTRIGESTVPEAAPQHRGERPFLGASGRLCGGMAHAQRSILITGCSTGIGLAAARTLKSRGWRVIATARKPQDLDRLSRTEGLEAIACEMTDPASIAACASAALERTDGKLTALYNNAAYGLIGAMEDITPDQLRECFEVNVIAVHDLTRRIIPAMRAQGRGRIVMCSSVLGLVSGPYRGPYCATKFALEAMSDALRLELAPAGIHVSLLEPGPIESEFLATTLSTFKSSVDAEASPHRDYYAKRMAQMQAGGDNRFKLGPEAVVAKLIQAIESPRPRARYKIGFPTKAAALLKRALPDRLMDQILKRM